MWWRLSEGLEELSIRWIQLRRTAGGDMVLMGGSPCVEAERKGLEELSIRGIQLRRTAGGVYGSNGRQPVCGAG